MYWLQILQYLLGTHKRGKLYSIAIRSQYKQRLHNPHILIQLTPQRRKINSQPSIFDHIHGQQTIHTVYTQHTRSQTISRTPIPKHPLRRPLGDKIYIFQILLIPSIFLCMICR